MATLVSIKIECDICKAVNSEEDSHQGTTFTWVDGTTYRLDVGHECWETLPHNTVSGLVDVAEVVQVKGARKSAAAAQLAAAPRRQGAQGPPRAASAEPEGEDVLDAGPTKDVNPDSKRRYTYDDYFKAWGEVIDNHSQLVCPECLAANRRTGKTKTIYNSNVKGGLPADQNRKMSKLRSHLANAHGQLMWQLLADLRGDPYTVPA